MSTRRALFIGGPRHGEAIEIHQVGNLGDPAEISFPVRESQNCETFTTQFDAGLGVSSDHGRCVYESAPINIVDNWQTKHTFPCYIAKGHSPDMALMDEVAREVYWMAGEWFAGENTLLLAWGIVHARREFEGRIEQIERFNRRPKYSAPPIIQPPFKTGGTT